MITLEGREDESPEAEQKRRQRAMVTEAEVLLHHVAETLLTLYLAHEDRPDCPWLEVARMRQGDLKPQLRKRFGGSYSQKLRREQLAEVFFGSRTPVGLDPRPELEQWEKAVANLDQLLMAYLDIHNERRNLYNAAKHGMAVNSGTAAVKLGEAGAPPLIEKSGPSITYLDLTDSKSQPRWQQTTVWIELDQTIALSYLACSLIQSMWMVARARYLGVPCVFRAVAVIAAIDIDKLVLPRSKADNPYNMLNMRIPLAYIQNNRGRT